MGFGPGGLDCNEVLADVFLYLDNEADPGARERMRQHLDDCAPCLRKFGLEQDVKELVARCCGGDVAPDSLRSRVQVRLEQVVVDSVEAQYYAEQVTIELRTTADPA
jgi:mycothiol system anti-sigma-R factor